MQHTLIWNFRQSEIYLNKDSTFDLELFFLKFCSKFWTVIVFLLKTAVYMYRLPIFWKMPWAEILVIWQCRGSYCKCEPVSLFCQRLSNTSVDFMLKDITTMCSLLCLDFMTWNQKPEEVVELHYLPLQMSQWAVVSRRVGKCSMLQLFQLH